MHALIRATMIHYINNKPHKNIQMSKPKQRALQHYRRTQRIKALKTFAIDITIMLAIVAALAAAYLYATA